MAGAYGQGLGMLRLLRACPFACLLVCVLRGPQATSIIYWKAGSGDGVLVDGSVWSRVVSSAGFV